MFRKAIATILIFVVVGQIGAFWAIFTGAVWIHKQTKELRLSNPCYWEHFELSESELKEISIEDDEIEINGKLYDIVCIKPLEEKFEIIAVADDAEFELRRNIKGLERKSTHWKELARVACSYSLMVYQIEDITHISLPGFESKKSFGQYPEDSVHKGVIRNLEQPPAI